MKEKVKQRILLVIMAMSVAPIPFAVNHPFEWSLTADNLPILALFTGAVFGYVGVIAIFWQIVLGTRVTTRIFFEDLAWTIDVHKKLGIYGTLFILLHPFLMVYVYGEGILFAFLPSVATDFDRFMTAGRIGFTLLLIVWVSSAFLRKKMSFRPWKYIHYLAYGVLPLALLHALGVGSSYDNTFISLYWKVIFALVFVFMLLRILSYMGFDKTKFKVISNNAADDRVHVLRLKSSTSSLSAKPGQYAYIQADAWGEEHPFTIIGSHEEDKELLFGYKTFGRYTQRLTRLQPGDIVRVDGPYGAFTRQIVTMPDLPVVFIAGGIGITPFIKHISSSAGQQTLFYCNQTISGAVFRDQLKKKLGHNYIDVISGEAPLGDNIETGLLRPEIIKKYIAHPSEYYYFICGPAGLMSASIAMLTDMGVAREQIHTEEFGF